MNEKTKIKEIDNLVGKAFEELSLEEMENLQGTGELEDESSPACVRVSVKVVISAVTCFPTHVH
jgi:type 2 lantibiotic (TIGR03893 family)